GALFSAGPRGRNSDRGAPGQWGRGGKPKMAVGGDEEARAVLLAREETAPLVDAGPFDREEIEAALDELELPAAEVEEVYEAIELLELQEGARTPGRDPHAEGTTDAL